jgi:hypothetical protein
MAEYRKTRFREPLLSDRKNECLREKRCERIFESEKKLFPSMTIFEIYGFRASQELYF